MRTYNWMGKLLSRSGTRCCQAVEYVGRMSSEVTGKRDEVLKQLRNKYISPGVSNVLDNDHIYLLLDIRRSLLSLELGGIKCKAKNKVRIERVLKPVVVESGSRKSKVEEVERFRYA